MNVHHLDISAIRAVAAGRALAGFVTPGGGVDLRRCATSKISKREGMRRRASASKISKKGGGASFR